MSGPQMPLVLTGDFDQPSGVNDAPRAHCDGSLVINSTQWFKLFEGATDIDPSTRIFVGSAMLPNGGHIKIEIGTRNKFEHTATGSQQFVPWSFPFSTTEDLVITAEAPANPMFIYYSIK